MSREENYSDVEHTHINTIAELTATKFRCSAVSLVAATAASCELSRAQLAGCQSPLANVIYSVIHCVMSKGDSMVFTDTVLELELPSRLYSVGAHASIAVVTYSMCSLEGASGVPYAANVERNVLLWRRRLACRIPPRRLGGFNPSNNLAKCAHCCRGQSSDGMARTLNHSALTHDHNIRVYIRRRCCFR